MRAINKQLGAKYEIQRTQVVAYKEAHLLLGGQICAEHHRHLNSQPRKVSCVLVRDALVRGAPAPLRNSVVPFLFRPTMLTLGAVT